MSDFDPNRPPERDANHVPDRPGGPPAGQPWQQPGGQQPPWPQPGGQQPPWQQPAPGQSWQQPAPEQAWQPDPNQQQGPWQQPAGEWAPTAVQPAAAPAAKKRTGLIVTVVAVVVALIAGGGVWFFASRTANSASGQGSPQAAVNALLTSLNDKDPIGVASQLAPAEAAIFADGTGDILTQLKRLGVFTTDASPNNLTGATIKVANLTFDTSAEVKINDHVSIVMLTGGTITATTDPSKIPLSDKMKAAIGDNLGKPETTTVNIADEVAKQGHPVRLATQKVDGKWYFSLFYTAADTWAQDAGAGNPTATDAIPAAGAASPEDVMNTLLENVAKNDPKGVIALLDPNSMAVMHDYGGLILAKNASDVPQNPGVTFSHAKWTVTDVSGGKKVSLGELTVTAQGQKFTLKRDPATNSLAVTVPGEPTITLDPDNIDSILSQAPAADVPPIAVDIIKREFTQIIGLGVVMTEDGGKWYIDPARTFSDVAVSLLAGLEPSDIDQFLDLVHS